MAVEADMREAYPEALVSARPDRVVEALMESHSDRPLGGYLATMGIYGALTGAFAAWYVRSGRRPPERMDPYDLALVTVATHKSARLITKDKILEPVRAPFTTFQGDAPAPAEVSERARGTGMRRSIGELLTCPYCLSVWIATAFAAGLMVAPRATRSVAAVFTAVFGADVLQIAYHRLAS